MFLAACPAHSFIIIIFIALSSQVMHVSNGLWTLLSFVDYQRRLFHKALYG